LEVITVLFTLALEETVIDTWDTPSSISRMSTLHRLEEYFVEIEEYPNYSVSNYGDVINVKTGRQLNQILGKKGYFSVRLWRDGGVRTFKVHNLVAQAFFLNYSEDVKVAHKNGVKTDNTVLNLTLKLKE